jgi:hypothetical protein
MLAGMRATRELQVCAEESFVFFVRFLAVFATGTIERFSISQIARLEMPLPNIVRRVRIYKLLRTGQAYSVDELASMMSVGRRTICRDLAVLRQGSDQFEVAEGNRRRSIRLSIGMLEPSGFRC